MWEVDNQTPFAAERGWVRDKDGTEIWLIALKCTFDILPDGTTIPSEDQPPVLRAPEYFGEPGRSSLKYESDLVLTKTTTDIVLVGHAYAASGSPTTEMDVGFRVGPVQKVLRVTGDRAWGGVGKLSPQAFTKMPLTYDRAFGGADARSADPQRNFEWRNPVGVGFAISRDNAAGLALPNVEYPGEAIGSWSDRPRPAGFTPIGSHWQPRAGFAGTYDDKWMRDRQPLLPDDFDNRYFQTVPPDQQAPAFMRGGEPVVLIGVTPNGRLEFVLPRVFPGFETRFSDGSRELHKDRNLHTIILEPDFPRVSLIWHSALPCHFKVQKLMKTFVTVKTELGELWKLQADAEEDEAADDADSEEIVLGDDDEDEDEFSEDADPDEMESDQ